MLWLDGLPVCTYTSITYIVLKQGKEKSLVRSYTIMTTLQRETRDGGYGWVVVFSSFWCHVIQYGLSWTVGVFYVIFFKRNRRQ